VTTIVASGTDGKRVEPAVTETQSDDRPAREYDPAYLALLRPAALKLAALDYARRGIAVFPLVPRGKTPITTNGFKGATIDAQQVMRWWTANPNANIGAPTGHAFDVIDIDGPDGIASMLERAPDLNHIGTPLLGRSITPRGGGHHLFVTPESWRRNGARLLPGVDCRALGGYVVLPPSRGVNGRMYRWLHPLSDGGAQ
jgi:hypothetical protein